MFEFLLNNFPLWIKNAVALQVAVPMILALFCAMTNISKISWGITFIATIFGFINSIIIYMSYQLGDFKSISYAMGGWAPPMGIEYKIDSLNIFFIMIVSFFALVLTPYAYKSTQIEIARNKRPIFYSLFLLCYAGLLGILSTNDIFNIYVFLEISSLTTYALIAYGKDRRALTASLSYLLLGTIGATFILIAIGLLYIMTGTLNLTDLAIRIADVKDTAPVYTAFAFLMIGVILKIALFPLHIWLTNAYAYAPSFVSAFLSCTATKVSFYVFIRFIFYIFGYEFSFDEMMLSPTLIVLSTIAILLGSIAAIYNPNAKRMLAFSSVAQMGYITLLFAIGTPFALAACLMHIFYHGLAKALLFTSVGTFSFVTGNPRSDLLSGIGNKMPLAMFGFIIGGLSLIGVPLFAGFVSKWYMISALIESSQYLLVSVILIASLMAVLYIWKLVEVIYFPPSKEKYGFKEVVEKASIEKSIFISLPLLVLIIANIYFGIFTEFSWGFARQTAEIIFSEFATNPVLSK